MIPVVVVAVLVAVVAATLLCVGLVAATVLRLRDLSASLRAREARIDAIGTRLPAVAERARERIGLLDRHVTELRREALPAFDRAAERVTAQLVASAAAGAAVAEGIRIWMERMARLAELARVLWWAR